MNKRTSDPPPGDQEAPPTRDALALREAAVPPPIDVTEEQVDDLRLFVASDQLPCGHDTRIGCAPAMEG